MANSDRYVRNVTRNCYIKLKQAERAIELCAAVWVVRGESYRDLTTRTLDEAIVRRNEQAAKRRIPERVLAQSEVYGVVYEPAELATAAHARELGLALQADHFAMVATHVEVVASC